MFSRAKPSPLLRSKLHFNCSDIKRFNTTLSSFPWKRLYTSTEIHSINAPIVSLNTISKSGKQTDVFSLTQRNFYVTFDSNVNFPSRPKTNEGINGYRYYARFSRVKKVFSDREREELLKSIQLETTGEQIKPPGPGEQTDVASTTSSKPEANKLRTTTNDENRALEFYKYQSMCKCIRRIGPHLSNWFEDSKYVRGNRLVFLLWKGVPRI